MSYSGAQTAKTSRENLGKALAALQEDPNIPPDVLAIAQNVAQAMASLFEAERAAAEPDGKAAVKRGLAVIGQTLALLQDVRASHPGIQVATASIAQSMSALYPLTTAATIRPPAPMQPPQGMGGAPMMGQPAPGYVPAQAAPQQYAPGVASVASFAQTQAQPPQQAYQQPPQQAYQQPPQQAYQQPPQQAYQQPPQPPQPPPPAQNPYAAPIPPAAAVPDYRAPAPAAPAPPPATPSSYRGGGPRVDVEVNIGANTDSNFYVGFAGEISEGGVFCATYNIQPRGTLIRALVTLPGNFQKHVNGVVRFVRDPMDLTAESEPGMGIQFEGLDPEARELILRFIRKRAPMFYDE